jgi:hypothetical protein
VTGSSRVTLRARHLIELCGGKTVRGCEKALYKIHHNDCTLSRETIAVIETHLQVARAREERQRRLNWTPMR